MLLTNGDKHKIHTDMQHVVMDAHVIEKYSALTLTADNTVQTKSERHVTCTASMSSLFYKFVA